jgi:ribosomal protein S27E
VKLLFFPSEAKVKPRLHKQNHKPIQSQTRQFTRDQTHTAKMAAIGSLVFCTDCGNLLETNTSRKTYLTCEVCGAQNKGVYRREIAKSA